MACVQYTAPVTVSTPTVSSLIVSVPSTGMGFLLNWQQNIAGTVKAYVDGVLRATLSGYAGSNQYILNATAAELAVNHQVCVE